ncbi:hypothetical protein HOLleu_12633 [Holothuria leucospilota]|uniref:Uncharacterized protein n=1 Tax=Holothuria leucospilota TaxID=206669 RepID=A0A9Q1C9J7_HOLLE|nr:hypothetical protein HOLleu_12633 [Holothuria leucospilota]
MIPEQVLRNGDNELLLFFEQQYPCLPPPSVVRHKFDQFVDQEFQFGVPEPNFSFCYTHPYDNHYCSTARQILDEVLLASPNICQSSWKSPDRVSCRSTVKIESITDSFREFLLLGEGPVRVVSSQRMYGNFTIGLKYPCLD